MDFHCHIDLYKQPREVYKQAVLRNEFTWLVTTSPRAYAATSAALGQSGKILITPGLHPEIAGQRSQELSLLLEQMAQSKGVGEVGLDGSARHRATFTVQRMVFSAVLARSAELGGRLLSIHSRAAATDVLEELAHHPGFGVAVLHWFSGTMSELKAAAAMGCWFSVGPAMFNSASGRRLTAAMPHDRVVPESDGPFAQVNGEPLMPWCENQTIEHLSSAWSIPQVATANVLRENSQQLLQLLEGHFIVQR
ncbi:MAG: Qat anti-phage system TatD family nuclease QatD [Hydrogenophaga sp.]|nr:Qat anti-phage system TatD family nuclease QatD [Hydrogenophaga sp.]